MPATGSEMLYGEGYEGPRLLYTRLTISLPLESVYHARWVARPEAYLTMTSLPHWLGSAAPVLGSRATAGIHGVSIGIGPAVHSTST